MTETTFPNVEQYRALFRRAQDEARTQTDLKPQDRSRMLLMAALIAEGDYMNDKAVEILTGKRSSGDPEFDKFFAELPSEALKGIGDTKVEDQPGVWKLALQNLLTPNVLNLLPLLLALSFKAQKAEAEEKK